MRFLHLIAAGIHLAGLCLFTWGWVVVGDGYAWGFWSLWCVLFGGLHTAAARKGKQGVAA